VAFFVPQQPISRFPTRRERLEQQFPQSVNILRQIADSVKPLKFGASHSDISGNYHFSTKESATLFFRSYLKRHFDSEPSAEAIRKYVLDTINLSSERTTTIEAFNFRASELISEINNCKKHDEPILKFIVGPTGAGKTLFSKCLFSAARELFWKDRIVTTRVEYSKFEHKKEDHSINEEGLYAYIRRCLFRDSLTYALYSDQVSLDDWTALETLAPRTCKHTLERLRRFSEAVAQTRGIEPYHPEIRHGLQSIWMEMHETDRDQLFYHISNTLSLRFVISFDGFDCVLIEDFLFGKDKSFPVEFLSRTLKSIKTRSRLSSLFAKKVEAHFLVYLRDSSFERLKMEIMKGVGRTDYFPVLWIVPPRYENLVLNVATKLTRSSDPAVNLHRQYANDIYATFDKHVFRDMKLDAHGYLNFLFGSNARRMNHHIAQSLLATLYRASIRSTDMFPERSGGVDSKSLWQTLVKRHPVSDLPRYMVLEDLFLHETRQLYPRLQVTPSEISRLLGDNQIAAAVGATRDRDETGGVFGCMFNYLVPAIVERDHVTLPALDVLIRIVQFIRANPKSNGAEVVEFLKCVGFNCIPATAYYFIYVLLRTEMIRYDGSSGASNIDDVPLFVTTRGEIALDAVMLSITYLSESMLVSLHSDRRRTRHLLNRDEDSTLWAIDCVLNASLAVHWIKELEIVEEENSNSTRLDFSQYLIGSRLENGLRNEASSILRNARSSGVRLRQRLSNIEQRAAEIKREYPSFKLLGDGS
jgi:hypothetical protein